MSLNDSRLPELPVWARAPAQVASDVPVDLTEAVSARSLWDRGVHLVFGVPAAFSPQCQQQHMAGYLTHVQALQQAGVQGLWCMSVNDPFVMTAWLKAAGAEMSIGWVADANAELSRALGVDMCLAPLSMGTRCKRFAMLISDSHVLHMAVEPPGQLLVSGAPYMLSAVRSYFG